MKPPVTRYAKSGEVQIAYQVVGQGPLDLVFVPGFISNLDVHWEDAGYSHLLHRLARFTRLILLDKRGTGLSDRVDLHELPDLKTRMDDVRAVMDAAGSGRAALLGASEGAALSILFAATHPERTRALVLYGAYAHFHTWVMSTSALEEFVRTVETNWGNGSTLTAFAPGRVDNPRFQSWWARFERLSASPTAAVALARMNAGIDVRNALSSIHVPTLVIHRTDDARVKITGGRYLAEKIKGARFVEIPGRDHPIWTGDVDRVADEIEEFLTGARPASGRDRVLAVLLLARLVTARRQTVRFGELAWSERNDSLRDAAMQTIAHHGGQALSAGPEEIGARFDGPTRAVLCALALRDAALSLDIDIAAGVYVGEIEPTGDVVTGTALHITGQIAARAVAGEILVSGVVAALAAGSGLHFAQRDFATVDGCEAPLHILAVTTEQHLEPITRAPKEHSITLLSAREREVLELVAKGLSNAVIAERLRLSGHTVKRHVANILLKLDLPTRAAAAAHMGDHASGWVTP